MNTSYKILAIGNLNENKTDHVRSVLGLPPSESEKLEFSALEKIQYQGIIYVNVYIKIYHTTDGEMTLLVWDLAELGSKYQTDQSYYKDTDLILSVNNGAQLTKEIASIHKISSNSKLFETKTDDDLGVISLLRVLKNNPKLKLL